MYGRSPVSIIVSHTVTGKKKRKRRRLGNLKRTSQQMTLQVLGVQICLIAMRTGEFPISILGRNGRVLRGCPIDSIGHWGSTARNTGQNPTTALRTDNLGARGILGRVGRRAIGPGNWVGIHPVTALAIPVAKGTRRHARIVCATVARRCGRNGLRIALSTGGRWQHAVRGRVRLRVLSLLSLRVRMRQERRRRQTPNRGMRHNGRGGRRVNIVGGGGKPGHVVAIRRLAHVGMRCWGLVMLGLQRRQCMGLRDRILRLHGVLRHRHAGDGGR